MNLGKGWKKDAPDPRDYSARGLLGARLGANPLSASLEGLIKEIWDQGTTSACVGHAFARAIQLRCAAMNTPIANPSRTAIYTAARSYERAGASTPLVDQGCFPRDAAKGITEWGVPSESYWPFDPAHINDEPTLEELEQASVAIVTGYYTIDTDGTDRENDVQQALAANYPVVIGVEVDSAMENYDGTGVVTAPIVAQELGGHMLCIVGYDRTVQGTTRYRICNSWSNTWGDHGLFWADSAWLLDPGAGDLRALTCAPSR
jgi:C1A family cysteine protease